MGVSVWARRPLPEPDLGSTAPWRVEPAGVADLVHVRRRLRASLRDGALPNGADDGERLLLVLEELVTNALRHGRPPVCATVSATRFGWLVAVDDPATDRLPIPALDRDPADGGMGLSLVARLCGAWGWTVEGNRKVVWARVPYLELLPPERIRVAAGRTLALAGCLAASAARVAATFDALASRKDSAGRSDAAHALRASAVRARLEAERARGVTIRASRPTAEAPAS